MFFLGDLVLILKILVLNLGRKDIFFFKKGGVLKIEGRNIKRWEEMVIIGVRRLGIF